MTDDFDVEALLEAPYKPKQEEDRKPSPFKGVGATVTSDGAGNGELLKGQGRDQRADDGRREDRASEEREPSGTRPHDDRGRRHEQSGRSRSPRSSRRSNRHHGGDYYSGSRDSHRAGGYYHKRDEGGHHRDRDDYRSSRHGHERSESQDRRHSSGGPSKVKDRRSRSPPKHRDRDYETEQDRRKSVRSLPPRSPSPEVDEEERDKRTVFVMQIAARCRTRELAEFFMQAGKVRDARIIADRNSRRSKGVGYVEFYSIESVQKALELSGQRLHGVPLIVQLTESEKNRAAEQANAEAKGGRSGAADRLYVGSIHFDLTEEDLRQVFEPFGQLEFIQLQRDETGKSKGYAFIQYKEAADAQLACARMNGFELAGRMIKVSPVIAGQGHSPGIIGMGPHGAPGNAGAMSATGANAFNKVPRTDMDESDAHGIALSSQARAELMQKLAREPVAAQGTPTSNPTAPRPPAIPPIGPTQCVLLKNMFDPNEEIDPNWDKDIEEDVKLECSKYGVVLHIHVEKDSQGEIYLKFDNMQSAQAAVNALDRRWFAGKQVSAVYLSPVIYHSRFPKAAHGRA